MHYKNLFEKTASVAGIRRKLPRNFCKAKPNKRSVAAIADAILFEGTRSNSMKPTLLLSDELRNSEADVEGGYVWRRGSA